MRANPVTKTLTAVCLLLVIAASVFAQQGASLRPPAVPLVTHDPYFSVWSGSTSLADDRTRHWTGAPNGMVEKWLKMADDGDHYRLAFDKPGTWSQKYNLVWDKLLGLNLFPPQVVRREISFYKTKQNAYGLPLDNRETYTKLDWIVWTATLAESMEDFRAFITPLYKFVNETPDRVPLTDWYGTVDAKQHGFQARSVVGGVYVKMLADPAMWKK